MAPASSRLRRKLTERFRLPRNAATDSQSVSHTSIAIISGGLAKRVMQPQVRGVPLVISGVLRGPATEKAETRRTTPSLLLLTNNFQNTVILHGELSSYFRVPVNYNGRTHPRR